MLVEKGYAKVNLVLEVVGKRNDGFHDLEMVSTTISLYDELYFTKREDKKVIIECEQLKDVRNEDNLIYQAIKFLQDKFSISKGVNVRVIKRIPIGAGLGGGSADAAATLRAMNQLFELNLSLDELAEIGLALGSDVPFCIYNKTAIVKGRGEKLQFIDEIPFGYVVMVHPNFAASTKQVFTNYRGILQSTNKVANMVEAIKVGDLSEVADCLYNNLEQTVDALYRRTGSVIHMKKQLIKYGAFNAVMTGSGSSIYGVCLTQKQASHLQQQIIANNQRLFRATQIGKGSYNVGIYTFRSSRKSVKRKVSKTISEAKEVTKPREPIMPRKRETVDKPITTKAYGRVLLGFSSNDHGYKIIEAPISTSIPIRITFLKEKTVLVKIDGRDNDYYLQENLARIIDYFALPHGLLIQINTRNKTAMRIFDFANYLAQIITQLAKKYNIDSEEITKIVEPRVIAYQRQQTYEYDTRLRKVNFLTDIPFSYVVAIPLNRERLNKPEVRSQFEDVEENYNLLKQALEVSDYYFITANICNSLETALFDSLARIKRRDLYGDLSAYIRKTKGNNFTLSIDGTTLFIYARTEKIAKSIVNMFKDERRYRPEILRIMSNVTHKFALPDFTLLEETDHEFDEQPIDLVTETEESILEKTYKVDGQIVPKQDEDFEEVEVFEDDESGYEVFHITDELPSLAAVTSKITVDHTRLYPLRFIHSPGSLFRNFDFVDITHFFNTYYAGRKISLTIDNEQVDLVFDMRKIPHIFGVDKLFSRERYRASDVLELLLNDKIKYAELKTHKLTRGALFEDIVEKTQSAFLVLYDLFELRLDNISVYHKDAIKGSTSQMNKLAFGITRKMTVNLDRRQHLLGIGYSKRTKEYFFYTSFEWKFNPSQANRHRLALSVNK